jgi:MazG family protein
MRPPGSDDNCPHGHTFPELVAVMKRLLGPGGCPWDREQDLHTLKPYLLEETYEVVDAIERGSPAEHCDELGDLLMQVVFQCELRNAEGAFGVDDVVRAIVDKLVRRHPHVFAEASADTADKVLAQWSRIKERERREKGEPRAGDAAPNAAVDRALSGVPLAMPALARAQQLTRRAANVGFDWPDVASCRDKLDEEIRELDRAIADGDHAAAEAEIGDLLFAAVNLARKLRCDAEGALRTAVGRFVSRFEYIEDRLQELGTTAREASLEQLDALWEEAKIRGM